MCMWNGMRTEPSFGFTQFGWCVAAVLAPQSYNSLNGLLSSVSSVF